MRDASPKLHARLVAAGFPLHKSADCRSAQNQVHMCKRKHCETIAANYLNTIGHLLLYEGPEQQVVQDIESRASSWQACVSRQRYFVRCTREYVDATASECIRSSEAREVTLIQMSFAEAEIWIALPGNGMTFVEAN
jgi:hypothetical protein